MLIYDIEIQRAIAKKGKDREEGIEYCNGWEDYAGMGISVVGVYDYPTKRYRVFTESNKDQFLELVDRRGLLVGFNNIPFDNKVIAACWGKTIHDYQCYDILREIWRGMGLDAKFDVNTHAGYGLGDCCAVNFGHNKTGNGALAPVEWQVGKIGNVIDYCLADVHLTKHLFEKIVRDGYIRNPKDPKGIIEVARPTRNKICLN